MQLLLIRKGSKDPVQLISRQQINRLTSFTKIMETFMKNKVQYFIEKKQTIPDGGGPAQQTEDFNKPRTQVVAVLLDIEKADDGI